MLRACFLLSYSNCHVFKLLWEQPASLLKFPSVFVFPSVYCLYREFSALSKSKPLVSPPWTRGRVLRRGKSKSWDNQPCLIPAWSTAVIAVLVFTAWGEGTMTVGMYIYVYVSTYVYREWQKGSIYLPSNLTDQVAFWLHTADFLKWKFSELLTGKTKIISDSGVCAGVSYGEE